MLVCFYSCSPYPLLSFWRKYGHRQSNLFPCFVHAHVSLLDLGSTVFCAADTFGRKKGFSAGRIERKKTKKKNTVAELSVFGILFTVFASLDWGIFLFENYLLSFPQLLVDKKTFLLPFGTDRGRLFKKKKYSPDLGMATSFLREVFFTPSQPSLSSPVSLVSLPVLAHIRYFSFPVSRLSFDRTAQLSEGRQKRPHYQLHPSSRIAGQQKHFSNLRQRRQCLYHSLFHYPLCFGATS
jgi:hypothetical protein